MRNLVIDIGNSNTKFGVFEGNDLLEIKYNLPLVASEIFDWLEQKEVSKVIVSDVRGIGGDWIQLLEKRYRLIVFNTHLSAGIESDYETQGTLGQDRWAKVIAVSKMNAESNSLVIDAGTCITTDFLEKGRFYRGGTISPGIQMRFDALHTYTGNLPLVNWDEHFDQSIGRNTTDAIQAGVLSGVKYEIEGHLHKYKEKYQDFKIYFSGGNSSLLRSQLKNSIFASQFELEPLLVLKGLNEVIKLETCN